MVVDADRSRAVDAVFQFGEALKPTKKESQELPGSFWAPVVLVVLIVVVSIEWLGVELLRWMEYLLHLVFAMVCHDSFIYYGREQDE